MERNDIWVFMSHSNKDYEKVCIVRNELEKHGFRPLMFFLKCLDDEKNDKEVETLIFREIDSRSRFILCKSINSQNSDWVKKEVEYIQGKNRFFFTINLDLTEEPHMLASEILRFTKRATVVLSYSRADYEIAQIVRHKLELNDFIVYDLINLLTGDDLSCYNELTTSIKATIDGGGYFVSLVSNNFVQSIWCNMELKYAIDCLDNSGYRRVIPIQIEEINPSESFSNLTDGRHIYDAYSNVASSEEDALKNRMMTPHERIATNIIDILYWEDMENEEYIQTPNTIKEGINFYEKGLKLYYHDQDHERIDCAAVTHLRKATILGNPDAMLLLANCYEYGIGVIKDKNKAAILREKAAKQNNNTNK